MLAAFMIVFPVIWAFTFTLAYCATELTKRPFDFGTGFVIALLPALASVIYFGWCLAAHRSAQEASEGSPGA